MWFFNVERRATVLVRDWKKSTSSLGVVFIMLMRCVFSFLPAVVVAHISFPMSPVAQSRSNTHQF